MIHIESDYSDIEAELDRLMRMPSRRMQRYLDQVLIFGYETTQASVHVRTGSLKTSGAWDSDSSRMTQKWVGTISYGGPSLGINNPVDYAIYEKERDGAHNFFAPLHLLHPLYIAAIKRGLSRHG